MKSKTLVSSSIQWDFCSFLSRERNADGIHHFWHNAIFVNELNSDNIVNEISFNDFVNESMISMAMTSLLVRLHYVDLLNRCGTRWYNFERLVRVIRNCSNVYRVTINSLSMNSSEILSKKSVSMNCQWINDLINEKKSSMKRL